MQNAELVELRSSLLQLGPAGTCERGMVETEAPFVEPVGGRSPVQAMKPEQGAATQSEHYVVQGARVLVEGACC